MRDEVATIRDNERRADSERRGSERRELGRGCEPR